MITLKPWQKRIEEQIKVNFKTHKTQALALYTAAGKTNIFLSYCRELIKSNPNVKIGISAYFTNEVRSQVYERAAEFGIKDKCQELTGAYAFSNDKNIYILNPQFLHWNKIPLKFDLVIIDEAHYGFDPKCKLLNLLLTENAHKDTKLILSSATLWDILQQKRFKDIPVIKRSLAQGFKDGFVADFNFVVETVNISFRPEDFTRQGDLNTTIARKRVQVLKSACLGKMSNLIRKYGASLGKKVIVICPPGNTSEIARTLAEEFKGLAFIEQVHRGGLNTKHNLTLFKNDASVRYLFVTNKCQVGFDMKELDTIIDLTMSRNIKILVQRIGRIARNNGTADKKYIYVHDKSLKGFSLDWVILTIAEFTMGLWEGWTTGTVKYRPVKVHRHIYRGQINSKPFLHIIKAAAAARNIKTAIEVRFVTNKQPQQWTLASAKKEAVKYKSRTDLWANDPRVYKWFRLNAMAELNKIFPLKHILGKWHEQSVIAAIKKSKTRVEFKMKYPGAVDWLRLKYSLEKRNALKDKYLPPSLRDKYTPAIIKRELRKLRSFSENDALYRAIKRSGRMEYYKYWWNKNVATGGTSGIKKIRK